MNYYLIQKGLHALSAYAADEYPSNRQVPHCRQLSAPGGVGISRADVAEFTLKQMSTGEHLRSYVTITY